MLAVCAILGVALFAFVDLTPTVEGDFFFSTDDRIGAALTDIVVLLVLPALATFRTRERPNIVATQRAELSRSCLPEQT